MIKIRSDLRSRTTPHTSPLTGELRGAFRDLYKEKWPRYIESVLYLFPDWPQCSIAYFILFRVGSLIELDPRIFAVWVYASVDMANLHRWGFIHNSMNIYILLHFSITVVVVYTFYKLFSFLLWFGCSRCCPYLKHVEAETKWLPLCRRHF